MKHLTRAFLAMAVAAVGLWGIVAHAAVPVPVDITYTLPTQACVSIDGGACTYVALTGENALTGVDVYMSTAPIVDGVTLAPVASLSPTAQSYVSTFQASNGAKVYVRLKAKTASAVSAFSNQASKDVVVTVTPGAPVVVSITIGVNP